MTAPTKDERCARCGATLDRCTGHAWARPTPGEHGHLTTADRDACPVCNPTSKEITLLDQSTAPPLEKLKRFLQHLAGSERSPYFYDDGFPRLALNEDAATFVKVLESEVKLLEDARNYWKTKLPDETSGRITPSADDDGVCNHCGLMFSPTSDASKIPCSHAGCSLPKWIRHHYHVDSPVKTLNE